MTSSFQYISFVLCLDVWVKSKLDHGIYFACAILTDNGKERSVCIDSDSKIIEVFFFNKYNINN